MEQIFMMKISRTAASCAILCLTLGASAMVMRAQENNKETPPPKRRANENKEAPRQHNAPAQQQQQPERQQQQPERQHTPPAGQIQQQQQRTPAPQIQQQTPTQQAPVNQAPVNQPMQRQERPARSPSIYQQPNNQPVNRTPPAANPQPGRTFGNSSGNNPSFNQPGRAYTPGRTFTTRGGDVVHRDAGGQVREVRMTNGAVVYHPPNAPRRVEMVRPNGSVVVASAPGHGYVQRQVVIQNTTIIKRTYVYNGVPQAVIYRPRVYNGVTLAVYTPVRYYRPTFYVYAYNPWPRPVVYGWGWAGRPWYGYYGGYFTPYPVYASPSLWLTDYLIAATLENAYQERMAERAAAANAYNNAYAPQGDPLTPEVKQAIADEVRRQIDQQRLQGQNPNSMDGNIFADNTSHVFVAGPTLLVNSNMGECTISEGDVVQMNFAPPPNSAYAEAIVLASRGRDCRKGTRVSVGIRDLQEMYNQMMATVDRGMGDLQSRQGQGGLPPLPQGSVGTIDSPYAPEAQPDANAAGELTTVAQEADRADQQAVIQSGGANGDAAPPTLSLGMGVDDVKSIQGEPEKIVDLGSKKIYVYKDLKITFQDGRVIDIQ
jgi:hypothetical protein